MPQPQPLNMTNTLQSFFNPFIPYPVQLAIPATQPTESHTQVNMTATGPQILDKAWYLDSGATNHFTQGPPPGTRTQPYLGIGKVKIHNGSYIDRNSIGISVINTAAKPLILHNLLYTPKQTKHLVSVSQFTKDNEVFFEFHLTYKGSYSQWY